MPRPGAPPGITEQRPGAAAVVTAPVPALTVARPAWIGDLGVWIGGAPMAKYPELAWQGSFLGIAAAFALASLAAARLRGQWAVLLGRPA